MIATRFRSVYWVGGVAVAALGCYLVSQRVAAERAELASVEASIVTGKREIRALETELGTRAGMNQLERWNVEVLSLSAPKPGQYLDSEVQLASLTVPALPAAEARVLPAAATAPKPAELRVTRAAYAAPEKAKASVREIDETPRVRQAVYVKPAADAQDIALLDDKLLNDLGRLAVSERTGGKRNR